MLLPFYMVLFGLAFIALILGMVMRDQLHQTIFSLLSVVVYAALALASFNIVIGDEAMYDLSLAMLNTGLLIIALINAFVIMTYGTIENFFVKKGV